MFYSNGSAIEYATSSHGESWSTRGSLPYATSQFSVVFQVIDDAGYVFLVSEAHDNDIVVQRGKLVGDQVTFEDEFTVFDGSGEGDRYLTPSLALDESGRLWVAAVHDFNTDQIEHLRPVARRSSASAAASTLNFDPPHLVGRAWSAMSQVTLLPLTGEEMYLLANVDPSNFDVWYLIGFRFDGTSWNYANEGGREEWLSFPGAINNPVRAIAFLNGEMYLGGDFTNFDANPDADYFVRWDGTRWTAVGAGVNAPVHALTVVGDSLYVGGEFQNAGGLPEGDHVARWDGAEWHPLGLGVGGEVFAISGAGDTIYVGGDFSAVIGVSNTARIARWDGKEWHALGKGVNGRVRAIALSGDQVYVGGGFASALSSTDEVPNTSGVARCLLLLFRAPRCTSAAGFVMLEGLRMPIVLSGGMELTGTLLGLG